LPLGAITTTTTTTAAPTTTTTTLPPVLNVNYITTAGGVGTACTSITIVGVTTDSGDFCTATQLNGTGLISLGTGTWYFSYGGQYIIGTTNGTSIATITSVGCALCSGFTTTTTTTLV
jgi:hypothetical protein